MTTAKKEAKAKSAVQPNQATATQSAEPVKTSESLSQPVEMEVCTKAMDILTTHGRKGLIVREALKLLIHRSTPAQLVQLILMSADLTDKFLLNWTIDSLEPEQKEAVLVSQREGLKEAFLRQNRRCWRHQHSQFSVERTEASSLFKLMELFDSKFRLWLIDSLGEFNLNRSDFGGDEQWWGLANLIHRHFAEVPEERRQALFIAALQCGRPSALCYATVSWSRHADVQSLSYATSIINQSGLSAMLRTLWYCKSIDRHNLAIALAQAKRSRVKSDLAQKTPDKITLSRPFDFLEIGSVLRQKRVVSILANHSIIDLGHSVMASLFDSDINWKRGGKGLKPCMVDKCVDVMVLAINDATEVVTVGIKQKVFLGQSACNDRIEIGANLPVRVLKTKLSQCYMVELLNGVQGYMVRSDHPFELAAIEQSVRDGATINVRLIGYDPNTFQPVFQYHLAPPKSVAVPAASPAFPPQMSLPEFKRRLLDKCESAIRLSRRELDEKLRQILVNKELIEAVSIRGGWQFSHQAYESRYVDAKLVYDELIKKGLLPAS